MRLDKLLAAASITFALTADPFSQIRVVDPVRYAQPASAHLRVTITPES